MNTNAILLLPLLGLLLFSCKKDPAPASASLVFKFVFDSTQQRLTNTGAPSALPAGHAGQSPFFNKMSAHYVELSPTAYTALGSGAVIYKAAETEAGGSRAINFARSRFAGHNEVFLTVPIRDIAPGTYEWLRVSLAYQNF